MKRLAFAFDVDGTLLNSKEEVLSATVHALHNLKKAGHVLMLCSGRPYFDMVRIAKEIGVFDYMVCNNGAYFYDFKTNHFHVLAELPKGVLIDFAELTHEWKGFFALHTTTGVYRAATPHQLTESDLKVISDEWHRFEMTPWDELVRRMKVETVTQASARATEDIIIKMAKEARSSIKGVEVHIAGKVYLDVNPRGISKLEGLRAVSRYTHVHINDFVAFGDSNNDLQMLEGVGLGICMGNGTPEAKAAAKEIIGSNDSEAIADKVAYILDKREKGHKW